MIGVRTLPCSSSGELVSDLCYMATLDFGGNLTLVEAAILLGQVPCSHVVIKLLSFLCTGEGRS